MIKIHLAKLMAERHLSAAKLARLAGVNRSTVIAMATERTVRVDLPALERVCIVLGCDLCDLMQIVADDPEHQSMNALPEPSRCP